MSTIRKILIANRGEIALRVIRTCKKLGISSVAVYSEADRNSRHVRESDEAFLLGPGPSSESYLKADKILEICQANKVDAIHPGYGFLSERASFAREVKNAGLIFIGPSPEAIDLMGSKLASKETVAQYNVPLVPGINEAVEDPQKAIQVAREIGFPVLIKASAGGGGKGMRVVEKESELESQMKMAISEAVSSFGDGAVFVEKYVGSPRHIEIQILADQQGNTVHLFERECSIQRRHQKLIEEAPSAVLTPKLREEMGKAAINVAKSCGYYGAGTVEFLLDENHNFYFLEMNTRLQVEHPVTEFITGLDLVEEQIRIAEGQNLSFTQEDLNINGHSIELRICAEDPEQDFLPAIGRIEDYTIPTGQHIRIDDFIEKGYEIPIYYDNMVSKLIVWAPTRMEAIQAMKNAIQQYKIEGIQTTLSFGTFVMNHDKFIDGDFDTKFIQNYYTEEARMEKNELKSLAAGFLAVYLHKEDNKVRVPKG
jgi:pyruvate carboxylase subunit A